MAEDYEVIIVGTGAGGGTLAHTLANAGRKILMLERGNFLPRETENWTPESVFVDGRYISPETWYDADGHPFQPQVHYFVGGATKLYGAALYRLRPQDFDELKHVDGVSPAWPLSYDDLEPYYTKAEWLYQVHGEHGADPTEGPWSKQYPWPAVSHEPRLQEVADGMSAAGYHPFPAPCGILLDEADRARSTCIRCAWCDGYPCMVHAKADADNRGAAAARSLQRHAARRRRSAAARDGCDGAHGDRRRRATRRERRAIPRERRRGFRRRIAECPGAPRVGQRQAPERSRQRLRPGWPELHVPQQQGGRVALQGAKRHGVPEDFGAERLLSRRRRLSVADRQHPDGREVERGSDEG